MMPKPSLLTVALDVRADDPSAGDALPAAALRGLLEWRGAAFIESADARRTALRITVLSDDDSWLNEYVQDLMLHWFTQGHALRWIHHPRDLIAGDVCFLLGCGTILSARHLEINRHTLAVHESDLPRGRGWSPMTWQVLEGADRIPVTLFEATAAVDAGSIHMQIPMVLQGTELVDDLRAKQAAATCQLCRHWVDQYPSVLAGARPQRGEPTAYSRRRASDSELDPHQSIASQFPLLRVADNERYPAFFVLNGERYVITITKDTPAE